MKIGFDIMGGDFAPLEAILGALSFLKSKKEGEEVPHLVLIGTPDKTKDLLPKLDEFKAHYTFVPCGSEITMHEHPVRALKEKTDSSIAIGFGMLAQKKIDAFISAGNTGAMMVGALYSVKAIPGVHRPTIASPIPKHNGKFNFLLDVGANADCKPEHLVQFATMGSLFAQHVLDLADPKVALLNIGEEKEKGNILAQATYPLLEKHPGIHFIGNKEGRDLLLDGADVFVCEGFVGNVIMKTLESFYQIFKLERKVEDEFLDQFNYEIYGGTPILGINAPVLIGHGISSALAFHSMLNTAQKMVASDLVGMIKREFVPE